MLPPLPSLADYGISPTTGFLPEETPLQRLPDPYYAKWESIVTNLQALLLSHRLRPTIDNMPILSTAKLKTEPEWRRAYVLMAFMLHGYIWGGDTPAEVRIYIYYFICSLSLFSPGGAFFLFSFGRGWFHNK